MLSETSCGIVVFREELPSRLYLLLQYRAGHWDFTKGHMDFGEKETHTAFREAKEETGLDDIELVFGFRERIEYVYRKGGEPVQKEVLFYLGRTSKTEVKLSDEHTSFEWLPFKEALARITYANAKEVLMKAENVLNAWGDSPKDSPKE